MKTYQYIIHGAALLMGTMFFSACTDTWDEHYQSMGGTAADAPTLLEHVSEDPDLAEFLRVAKYVGYDNVLKAPQSLTLFAPVISKDQADSVIAVYEAQKKITDDKGNLRQDKDNTAITQFMQNHIALFGRSSNTTSNDSLRMWNGKYMIMTNEDLNNVPYLKKNIVASNGIMFKLATKESFLPNVRESFLLKDGLDSISNFYKSFDRYELDPEQSVQRDIVDGEVVYADSVINLSNALYDALGYIQREDSSYMYMLPTNTVWDKEYAEYRELFQYTSENSEERLVRDSLEEMNARVAIIRGRVFNLNEQKNDYQDSIKNTAYLSSYHYYGLNVFPNPKVAYNPETNEGILSGLETMDCSNGFLTIDNEGRIDPRLTFQQARYVDVSRPRNYAVRAVSLGGTEATFSDQSKVELKTVADTATYNGVLHRFETLKDKQYIEVAPNSFSATISGYNKDNDSIYFYLPNTMANMYYNVYVVMVPAYANKSGYDEKQIRPLRFQCAFSERLDGSPRSSGNPNDDIYFPTTNKEIRLKQGSSYNFVYEGQEVEAICIDKARKFAYSSLNMSTTSIPNAQRYRISSAVQTSKFSKGEQTNVLRINRVIYIPFATEEEANAFELDLSNLKEYIE